MSVQYPSEVRRRAQEADAQIKEFAQQAGPTIELTSSPPPPDDPPATFAAISPPEAAPDTGEEDTEPNVAPDGGPEPDTEAKTISFVPRAEAERLRARPEAGWEQRYKVLQGKFNREISDMKVALRAQEQRNDDLRELLAYRNAPARESAQETPANLPQTPKRLVAPAFTPVSDDEVRNFGKDYLDAASRYTLQQLDPVVRPLLDELENLKGEVRRVSSSADSANRSAQQSALERAKAALAASVPDYEAINTAPEFLAWLDQKDRLSGMARSRLLEGAWRRGDNEAVVAIFQAFKAEYVDVNEHVAASPGSTNGRASVDKATLVGPARGRSAQRNGTQQEQIVWTESGIRQFFQDDRQGKFKGNLAERDRLEADIFLAQRTGRVQP